MTTKGLIKLEEVVTEVLEESAETRSDDYLLFIEVCKKLHPEALNLSFAFVMLKHKELLPNWESVSRARRKVQERRVDLESERAKKHRLQEEKAYIEYSQT